MNECAGSWACELTGIPPGLFTFIVIVLLALALLAGRKR